MADYIKIDRKILDWEWYKNEHTKNVFLHCLLKANWKDGKFQGRDVPRGSFVTSVKKIASELELTEDEVKTALKHLIKTGELTKQTTNKFTVITVVNYGMYQNVTKQIPNKSQTIPKPLPTIEEGNKGNKGIYKQIIDLYNEICVSFPKVHKLSENRKKAINARLKMYSLDDFKQLFELSEKSDFLKGRNDRNWSANFDWIIKDSSMAKILDGNYNNPTSTKNNKHSFEQRQYSDDDFAKMERLGRQRLKK